MAKFKVGDRVKRITCSNGSIKVGDTGTVVEVLCGGDYNVKMDRVGGVEYNIGSYLTSAEPQWQPKVGDRVSVTYGHGWDGEGLIVEDCEGFWSVKLETGERAGYIGGFVLSQIKAIAPAPERGDAGGGFKVGDKIRLIASPVTGMPIGSEFTAIAKGSGYGSSVHFLFKGTETWRPGTYFELVTSTAKPDPKAIVALIEDGQPKSSSLPHVHTTVESADAEALRLANLHRGQKFGVYVLSATKEVSKPIYEQKWQTLAADGKKIDAIKELRHITGLQLKLAKDAVESWLAAA